jgi:hypothetical protein
MSASTATSANDRQVGGRHYKTGGLQHWDLFGIEYLMGCASKYVARHMDKNGREDLEKAIHYCEKALELANKEEPTRIVRADDMLEWARGTKMTGAEVCTCFYILCYADFQRATTLIRELINLRYPTPGVEPAGPGTPEDGGHHALQPVEEEGEEIVRWTRENACDSLIPPSLSIYEWHHRCDPEVQECYEYNYSASRYLIKEKHRRKTLGYVARS